MGKFLHIQIFFLLAMLLCTGCVSNSGKTQTATPTLEQPTPLPTAEQPGPSGALVYLSDHALYRIDLNGQVTQTMSEASNYLQKDTDGLYLINAPSNILLFNGYDPLIGCPTFHELQDCVVTGPDGFFDYNFNNRSAELIRPYTVSNISFSPGGEQFVYAGLEFDTPDYQVHLKLSPAGGGVPNAITTGHVVDTYPSWSLDGKWIAFLRYPSPSPKALQCTPEPVVFDTCTNPLPSLYLIHPNGSGLQKLADNLRLFHSPYNQPAWSPDGQTLAVVSGNPTAYITLVKLSDGSIQTLKDYAPTSAYPVWSPDSSRLAFTTAIDGKDQVVSLAADGSQARIYGSGSLPVWSPDGEWLAYLADREVNGKGLVVISADGQTVIDLHTPAVSTLVLWLK